MHTWWSREQYQAALHPLQRDNGVVGCDAEQVLHCCIFNNRMSSFSPRLNPRPEPLKTTDGMFVSFLSFCWSVMVNVIMS